MPPTTKPTAQRPAGQWALIARRFKAHRVAVWCLYLIGAIYILSLFAGTIAPYKRDAISLENAYTTPFSTAPDGSYHLLGTDHLGRDSFTRLIYAARVSLTTALTVTTISTLIGIAVGLTAGYFGGIVDTIVSRSIEFISTFPTFTLLLIAGSIAIQSSDAIPIPDVFSKAISLIMAINERESKQVVLIITIFVLLGWTGVARFVRGMVLSVREQLYVESSRALGASHLHNILTHVLPNAMPPIIVAYTLGLSGTLVSESALSFLGFGIQDPTPSWGNMLSFANSYMFNYPWMPLVPTLPILVCSLAINYIGDGLRDALDPRIQTEVPRSRRDALLKAIRERSAAS
jgi:peptide/nickel transport system permease protein